MHLLEAAWDTKGRFLVWAECSNHLHNIIKSTKDNQENQEHPFACSQQELNKIFETLDFEPDSEDKVEILLPSNESHPLPSPSLVGFEELERTFNIQLSKWRVPVCVLEPVAALGFLTSLPKTLPQGISLDDSVLFWLEATKLNLDLLTRGRFLPGMHIHENNLVSHWHLVPTDENDHKRLALLAECMPPLCRALTSNSKNNEPNIILESFLSRTCDSLIRLFLRSHNLYLEIDLHSVTPKKRAALEWLKSLTKIDSLVGLPTQELSRLNQQLNQWSKKFLSSPTKHELRTIFRLNTPQTSTSSPEKDKNWTLEFFIQSKGDSSLCIGAEDIWSGNLGFLEQSEYTQEEIEETLLKSLGHACALFPDLMQALKEENPIELKLSTDQAYEFLKKTSKLLEQADFGIELPGWWEKPTANVGLKLTIESEQFDQTKQHKERLLGVQQLLDCSWEVTVGDRILNEEDFEKLASEGEPLIFVNGAWVELEPEKVQTTLEFFKKQKKQNKMKLVDALRLGLGIDTGTSGIPVQSVNASGWVEKLLESQRQSLEVLKQPKGFTGDLRSYQLEGFSWLMFLSHMGIGGCLADDMGLGKTIQLLCLLLSEKEFYQENELEHDGRPTLLVVPMSILENWQREAEKFAPDLKIYIHHGPSRFSEEEFFKQAPLFDVVVTTYSLAHRDENLFSATSWKRIALDEAQNIKNLSTKQTQAVRRISQSQIDSPMSSHRIALTGTPLENHLEELWSIFDFLNPGLLGSVSEFRTHFSIPIERYNNTESAESLTKVIQPFVLRRLKTDPEIIQDLPEKIEMDVFTPLSEEQTKLYQTALEQMLPNIESASGIHRKGLVLSTITKLKQICDHPVLFLKDKSSLSGRSGKLDRLEELLEVILAEKDKALIFTQYAQMGHLLKAHLQERFSKEVIFLHGALSRAARSKLIEKFQKDDGPPIFILSLKAGGFGLNLTQANQVIHFDQWWNPAVEEQATDRAYRIGQKRNVQVRKFICKGTLEERIHQMLQSKRELADSIIGSTKNMITQLSTEELKELLSLSAGNLKETGDNLK